MVVRVHLLVRGRVQGVWYRGSMQEEAHRVGVTGWVSNCPDGGVEAEVQGEPSAVDALVAWAREGPPSARVTSLAVTSLEPAREAASGFAIRG